MKHLIMENVLENRSCRRVVLKHVAIDSEPACRGLLRYMKEGEHRVVRLFLDLQVIETMAAGREPVRLKPRLRRRWPRAQKRRRPPLEQDPVTMFVDRVDQKQ